MGLFGAWSALTGERASRLIEQHPLSKPPVPGEVQGRRGLLGDVPRVGSHLLPGAWVELRPGILADCSIPPAFCI